MKRITLRLMADILIVFCLVLNHNPILAQTNQPAPPINVNKSAGNTGITNLTLKPAAEPYALDENEDNGLMGEAIGWGGGGFMSRVVYHPRYPDVNIIYAANNMGGIFKSSDGGENWTYLSRNLIGQDIRDMAIFPGDATHPETIYVQTNRTVEKSIDGGQTWRLLTSRYEYEYKVNTQKPLITSLKESDSNATASMKTILIHPSNPDIIYVAGEEGKDNSDKVDYLKASIYKSIDGGAGWNVLQQRVIGYRIEKKEVATGAGIYTWKRIWDDQQTYFPGPILTLLIDPQNFLTMYVSGGSGFYKSTDGGITWRQKINGLPLEPVPKVIDVGEKEADGNRLASDKYLDYDLYEMVIDPTNSNIIYVLTRTHGIHKTIDAGENWFAANGPSDNPSAYLTKYIELDPYKPTDPADWRFREWDHSDKGVCTSTLIIDPVNPNRLLATFGTRRYVNGSRTDKWSHCNFYETLDAAKTWHQFYSNSTEATVDVDYPYKDRKVAPFMFGVWAAGASSDLALEPQNPDVVVGTDGMGLNKYTYNRSLNKTERRILYRGLISTSGAYSFGPTVVSLNNGQKIYATGCDMVLIKSTDGGNKWVSILDATVTGNGAKWFHGVTIQVVDTNPATIFFGVTHLNRSTPEYPDGDPGGVYKSTNDGLTWIRLTNGFPDKLPTNPGIISTVTQIVLDPDYKTNQTLYSVFNAFGVYKSIDGGENWQAMNNGLEEYIDNPDREECLYFSGGQGLVIDPDNSQILYLAARVPTHILFKSIDGGNNWKKIDLPKDLEKGRGVNGYSIGEAIGGTTIAGTGDRKTIFISGHRGILLSRDGGKTWNKSFTFLDFDPPITKEHIWDSWTWVLPLSKVVADPINPKRLFFSVSSWGHNLHHEQFGIYMSEDYGDTWRKLFELPHFGGNINVSDDGKSILAYSAGADIWKFDLSILNDITAPTISDIFISDITETQATISWATNEPADNGISYGLGTNYNLAIYSPALTTEHVIDITDLSPNTTYHFQVVSKDTEGNQAQSLDYSFTTLTPPNSSPVLEPIDNKTINEGVSLEFQVSAADPDGDSLVYSAAGLPQGASFDVATHIFTWTPDYTQAGSYQVTFTVKDPKEATASKTITITVNNINRAPVMVIKPTPDYTVYEGKNLTFIVSVNDLDTQDTLVITLSGAPDGATFINNTFSWMPNYTQSGIYLLTLNVSDANLEVSQNFKITVKDAPQEATVIIPPPTLPVAAPPPPENSEEITVEPISGGAHTSEAGGGIWWVTLPGNLKPEIPKQAVEVSGKKERYKKAEVEVTEVNLQSEEARYTLEETDVVYETKETPKKFAFLPSQDKKEKIKSKADVVPEITRKESVKPSLKPVLQEAPKLSKPSLVQKIFGIFKGMMEKVKGLFGKKV